MHNESVHYNFLVHSTARGLCASYMCREQTTPGPSHTIATTPHLLSKMPGCQIPCCGRCINFLPLPADFLPLGAGSDEYSTLFLLRSA